MKKFKINSGNLILLAAFAAGFSILVTASTVADRNADTVSSAPVIVNTATETATAYNTVVGEVTVPMAASTDVKASVVSLSTESETKVSPKTAYSVVEYEAPVTMYTSDTVNVRAGAGTDYDKVGKLRWGNQLQVTGETDNGWYEVIYDGITAFIKGDYMVRDLPGTPYVFVGDSRTVQMQMAVGSSDKAYIAKVGEGYSWFKNTALSQIPAYAGNGTTMIINFGVNDLGNVSKYISLINSNIDAWTEAGITVYYAAVTPVGDCTTVSNAQIESFNSRMQSELDPRIKWLDGYSYLTQTGFSTADGLHYNKDTYRSLYSYYMSVIDSEI
ncbi:MAG: SH3 domain-containing protein [Butyrivibrio sp.]|nr:SH3 domain-containing protein [Butyrivibrio sp.]